jgi:hypothetical protein
MNFPRFWAKGTHQSFTCWRWSDSSAAEAEQLAREAARKLAERFARGITPQDRYAYADRPLREPVLREFWGGAGSLAAVITRNSYGCLVLNTSRVMFVDVDLPQPKRTFGGLLKGLFGKAQAPQTNDAETRALAQAEAWAQRNPGWGWRVYRTRAGLRLLATHAIFEPEGPQTQAVFDATGTDPLYRRLCAAQKCFRARLTPKPWRCGVGTPPVRWPWLKAGDEETFQKWEGRYQQACRNRATCERVATFGNEQIHPDVQVVLQVHDETTRADSRLSLA